MRHLRNQGMETFNGERARAERGDARTVEGREPREEKGEEGTGKGHSRMVVGGAANNKSIRWKVMLSVLLFSYYADADNFAGPPMRKS